MNGMITSWTLRLGAWLLLLAVVGRLALDSRSAWLNGRLMQMEVLFESRRAGDALFRELGLDRHFDPARYRIQTPEFNRFKTPVWLQLMERDHTDEHVWGPYIWLEADGACVLPALTFYPLDPDAFADDPWRIRLSDRNHTLLRAAVYSEDVIEAGESTVWIHRGDRWVNVLRIISQGGLAPPTWKSDAAISELSCWSGSTELRLVWDPATESFAMPASAPAGVISLPPLPDQVGLRPPPKHRLSSYVVQSFVDQADLDGLEEYYAAAAAEYRRDLKIPESLLNEMGYKAIELERPEDAIRIFKRNIELYPDSPNAYDSLADAYEKNGELGLALTNYNKAVQLGRRNNDPSLSIFEDKLKRLKSSLAKELQP